MAALGGGVLVAALAAVFVPPASAMPPGGPGMAPGVALGGPMLGFGGRGLARVMDELQATPEQRSQAEAILKAAREDTKNRLEATRGTRQQLLELFAQPTVDANAAERLRLQMQATHDAIGQRAMQTMVELSRVFTPEQRRQLVEKLKQRGAMADRHRRERDTLEGGRGR
jgi:Spy/CpxP family protein refolding chaperone